MQLDATASYQISLALPHTYTGCGATKYPIDGFCVLCFTVSK